MKVSQRPKISVIMSVYNGMPYLEEAVESILNQTYKNFEFIIVDDASSDDTWRYLTSLKDKRIKLIKNRKNLGLATSLNIALRQAQGDFIARMDADDVSLPHRLATQVEFMEKNSKIGICGSWVDKINEKGDLIGEVKYPVKDSDIKRLLAWQPSIVHPTFFARKLVFQKLNNYSPKFDYAEEYELLMRAKSKFVMANIPEKLLLWRFWDKRRSRQSWDKMEKVDLKIKQEAFKRGEFGPFYVLILSVKFFITYILPYGIKVRIFKLFNMI